MEAAVATPASAFAEYLAVRDRLPRARPGGNTIRVGGLAEAAEGFDVVLLDAYGVLNLGEAPVPGAVERVAALRRAGKRVMVVSNSAGYPKRVMMARHARLGFDFAPDEVVSSREALLARLAAELAAALGPDAGADLGNGGLRPPRRRVPRRRSGALRAGGELCWWGRAGRPPSGPARGGAARLGRAVLVGNPDLVAPREGAGSRASPERAFRHGLAEPDRVRPSSSASRSPAML